MHLLQCPNNNKESLGILCLSRDPYNLKSFVIASILLLFKQKLMILPPIATRGGSFSFTLDKKGHYEKDCAFLWSSKISHNLWLILWQIEGSEKLLVTNLVK